MASSDQVKQYLAYWFQLGKRLKFDRGEAVLPQPVIQGNRYSPEFEACWQQALRVEGRDCYLEGTDQTVADLLSSNWDVTDCARCGMPVPTINLGVQPGSCPCFDLSTWPNPDLPQPRSPVDSRTQLEQIRDRLSQGS
ncbi:MAG: hypothetical protein HC827_19830 [Cyanobacteria bacterium RM1_2_2]|nr:hypothetical protein [Cyanobacteria bacterium RM1_2_2]